ncbi:hypothetical protein [Bacillus cihuensis]|nr:hypothetical protein [Bacillus cihuensis]
MKKESPKTDISGTEYHEVKADNITGYGELDEHVDNGLNYIY